MPLKSGKGQKPRPAGYFGGDDSEVSVSADVVIDNGEWLDTGLLDQRGNPLYRRRLTVKLGFV